MPIGRFVVVEGVEGAGKSTALDNIQQIIEDTQQVNVVRTREPGGTYQAEKIRQLVLTPDPEAEPLTTMAELLLVYASRIQLVDSIIKPALARGDWVLGDRHDLSTKAYQGGGRQGDLTWIAKLSSQVLGDFKPNLTFYLDVSPEVGLTRIRGRGALDRIESEDLAFFNRVRATYQSYAAHSTNIITIDCHKDVTSVTKQISQELQQWLVTQ